MNLSEKVDNITLKVRELAFKLKRMRKENAALRQENKELRAALEKMQQHPGAPEHHLKKENTQRDSSNGEASHSAKSETLRKQIDQYIKEIDECIEWLSNN